MIKKYKITGLDCPNCARSLEKKLNELKSIDSAQIDFVKSSLVIDSKDEQKSLKDAIKLTKKLEPDAKIEQPSVITKANNKKFIIDISLLTIGIILAILIFTVKMPTWLYYVLLVTSALLMGYKTYYKAFMLLTKGVVNENFLVTLSVVGVCLINEQFDGLMVIALYSIGKCLESLALNKSKKSIEQLTNLKPEFAVRFVDDKEEQISLEDIKIGDIIVVRAGEKIAVDGIVSKGEVSLNAQSLTGESLPQNVKSGDAVLSGSVVLDGVVYIKATSVYENSTASKILDLIQNASNKKAKAETVISKISKWYTLIVIGIALIVWSVVFIVTKNFNTALYRGLIFLVISCPCAFAISVPLAYFSGIGNASKKGILIKGSNYLDILAKLNFICFDKTGTLTTGEFEITNVVVNDDKYNKNQIIYIASLGEQYSNHPLAKAILNSNTEILGSVENFKEEAGKGVSFDYKNKSYFVGRKNNSLNATTVEVYENDNLVGYIELKDAVKPNSKQVINNLKQLGVKTVMLSGDNEIIAKEVADNLLIDEYHAKMLPQDKFDYIESNKSKTNVIGFVGDGLNDAPSLTLADVGISMGLNGSSASIEASDIVISNDNLDKIVEGIKISKYTRKIVWQNIIVSAVVKVLFLTLGAFGVTGMLSAVIADVGVTLLAIINSLRALRYKAK